ncbi:prepilin peptidase [Oceanimonas doudoroffii]|uniref:Prepilin type IV endopeptidase peptidase domain-containing protein n=1 Tax=Oceanimonas doudoroffii TaxID=84158 RepID=A0A233RBW6_9GAMM|nr:A24 family peptidase [Oceanimonas doudoroffii]OXY80876.1 hypothetical protein B6S08_15745 [Oceanimonas doudoroffii]
MTYITIITWITLCAWQDAREKKISNQLILYGLGVALIWMFYFGTTLTGQPVSEGITAALLSLSLTLPGYLMGKMGSGDVKMMMTLSLACGSTKILWLFFIATVVMIIWLYSAPKVWNRFPENMKQHLPMLSPEHVNAPPYAPFILTGALFSFPLAN